MPVLSALYPFHPRLVHFPIALSLVGSACVLWGLLRTQERWVVYGRRCLLFGWIGALIAALSGLVDQSRAPDTPAVSGAINQHITVGIALIVVLGLTLYWPLRERRLFAQTGTRWAYLVLLVACAALVLLEAWLGGRLVYHLGVGVMAH